MTQLGTHVTPSLLGLAAALKDRATRTQAAGELARALGAESLVIFVRDDEVGRLLPAPGFAQTLPDGRKWAALLDACVAQGQAAAELTLVPGRPPVMAEGHAAGEEAAVVLLNRTARTADLGWLLALLPLLATLFREEQGTADAERRMASARETAARATSLAKLVDQARRELEEGLDRARRAQRDLELANTRLSEQSAEAAMVNRQLREQAEMLEAQAMELEIQSDELQAANVALEEARRVAEAANKAKSEFMATMSHELRTPLNAIGGHAQLMQMGLHGPVTPEQQESLGRIDRSQRHLLGLINNILNLARIEAGRVEYRITNVLVGEVLNEVMAMMVPQFEMRGLTYEVSPRACLQRVRADQEKLAQILLNLLSNAAKFTDQGGRVLIDAEPGAPGTGTVHIRVSDNGQGIPADKLEFIFEPFTQVDASPSRIGQGTGLGLAISRDLAHGMSGDLVVRSELGAGSEFTLTLVAAGVGESPRDATDRDASREH